MGRKIHPTSFRLGVIFNWRSRWLNKKFYRHFLEEDFKVREFLTTQFRRSGLSKVEIERSGNSISVNLETAKPGLIIGRGGTGLIDLKKKLEALVMKLRQKRHYGEGKWEVKLSVVEIRKPESDAQVMAQNIAADLEKRMHWRRVLKTGLERIMSQKEVYGAKIALSGRLGGSEMSRREWLAKGKVPLQTLRANIDYGQDEALTTYGVIGIKVWIYKGEVFSAEGGSASGGENRYK